MQHVRVSVSRQLTPEAAARASDLMPWNQAEPNVARRLVFAASRVISRFFGSYSQTAPSKGHVSTGAMHQDESRCSKLKLAPQLLTLALIAAGVLWPASRADRYVLVLDQAPVAARLSSRKDLERHATSDQRQAVLAAQASLRS